MRSDKPKYVISIDVQDRSIDGPVWRNYGSIESYGNSLPELFSNATVDIADQDGGEVAVIDADAAWMQDLIAKEYELLNENYSQLTDLGYLIGLVLK